MPLYEYQCTKCGERSEIIQRFSDPPYSTCTKCGGEVKKLFSAPAIQFKGSGFYKTDYASASSSPPASATESKSDGNSDSKTETKSETRSDTKKETRTETKTETKSPAAETKSYD